MSFLAPDDTASYAWRQDFIETFLSRDAARFGITLPPEQLRRFWTMLAHLHGSVLHPTELSRALSIDQKTASRYVDILCGAFLVRRLPPWFENVGKRVVKAPKIYLRDSGLLHALLGLRNGAELRSHPRYGASWEGFRAGIRGRLTQGGTRGVLLGHARRSGTRFTGRPRREAVWF